MSRGTAPAGSTDIRVNAWRCATEPGACEYAAATRFRKLSSIRGSAASHCARAARRDASFIVCERVESGCATGKRSVLDRRSTPGFPVRERFINEFTARTAAKTRAAGLLLEDDV